MHNRDKWRWTAMVLLPVLMGSVATAIACHDSSAPNSSVSFAESQDARKAAEGHARRHRLTSPAFDWIGVAHNTALDDLRAQMRAPGILTKDFCTFAVGFFSRDERFPAAKPRVTQQHRMQAAKAALKDSRLCRSSRASSLVVQSAEVSGATLALAEQIQADIDAASDRYDLANRLASHWTSAQALSPAEAEIIGSMLSVAQASFEYWEVEVARANQEFAAEYSACATAALSSGYDTESARQLCLEGGIVPTLTPKGSALPSIRMASLAPRPGCGLSSHFKALAKSDAVGAFSGAVKGALTAGLAGIAPGAFVGAAVGSATSWAYSAFELYVCALK